MVTGTTLAFILVLGIGFHVQADPTQEPGDTESARVDTGKSKDGVARRRPRKVIEMDTLEVIGKVQKPRVYYLIGRSELAYEGLPMDRDLMKEIEDTLEGSPF